MKPFLYTAIFLLSRFTRADESRRNRDVKNSRQCDNGRCSNLEEEDRVTSVGGGNIMGSGGRCSSSGSGGLRLTPDGYPSEESLNDSPMHATSAPGITRDPHGTALSGAAGGYGSGGSGSAGSLGPGCCRQPHRDHLSHQ